jgi:hypothetical protein
MTQVPFEIRLGKDDDAVEKGRELLDAVLKKAQEMGMPEDVQGVLKEKLGAELEKARRDGPGLTTARSLVALIKGAEKSLGPLEEGMLSLAKLVKKGSSAYVYALGGIGSDIDSAKGLLQAARTRLREVMDADPWERGKPKAEPESKPAAEPAAAQPGAE